MPRSPWQRTWRISVAAAASAAISLLGGCSQVPLDGTGRAAGTPSSTTKRQTLPPSPSLARKPSAITQATDTKTDALAELQPDAEPSEWEESGVASRYAGRFKGRRTANGERYNPRAFTAAHPTLPFGTWVRVRNTHNDAEVRVRINDRGPFVAGRVIDLSYVAAQELGLLRRGLGEVTLRMDDASLSAQASTPSP